MIYTDTHTHTVVKERDNRKKNNIFYQIILKLLLYNQQLIILCQLDEDSL
jgi:hypothetical protein